MPLTYSPTARLLTADPSVPDGSPDLYDLTTTLADTRAYLRALSSGGSLQWSGMLHAYGTDIAPFVALGPITSVALNVGTGWANYSQIGGVLLNASNVSTPNGGPLNANEWYYVYAYVTTINGVLSYDISNVPPTTGGLPFLLTPWKRGQTANYRYLGSFRTDGNGYPIPVWSVDGDCTYDRSAAAGTVQFEVNGGVPAPAAWTDVSVTFNAIGFIPPHATLAKLQVEIVDAAGARIHTRTTSADTGFLLWPTVNTLHDTGELVQPIALGATAFQVKDDGISTADEVYFTVTGWRE